MTFNNTFPSEDLSVIGQTKDVQVNFWAEDNSVNVTIPGKLTRVKTDFSDTSYSDEVEVAIPFEQLKVEATSSQTITYSNANLGEQTITVTGGSTGPWILAGIAVVIAGYSFGKLEGNLLKQSRINSPSFSGLLLDPMTLVSLGDSPASLRGSNQYNRFNKTKR